MVTRKPICYHCEGMGWYQYDDNHSAVCGQCCLHTKGWFKLKEHYGKDNGKLCCKAGCGAVRQGWWANIVTRVYDTYKGKNSND